MRTLCAAVICVCCLAALGACGRSGSSGGPDRFVASTERGIAHRPDCAEAKKIKEDFRAWFRSMTQAKRNGCRPCKICRPE